MVIGPRGSAHINGRADGYDYAFFDVTIWESENRMLKSGATGDGRVRGLYKASGESWRFLAAAVLITTTGRVCQASILLWRCKPILHEVHTQKGLKIGLPNLNLPLPERKNVGVCGISFLMYGIGHAIGAPGGV